MHGINRTAYLICELLQDVPVCLQSFGPALAEYFLHHCDFTHNIVVGASCFWSWFRLKAFLPSPSQNTLGSLMWKLLSSGPTCPSVEIQPSRGWGRTCHHLVRRGVCRMTWVWPENARSNQNACICSRAGVHFRSTWVSLGWAMIFYHPTNFQTSLLVHFINRL